MNNNQNIYIMEKVIYQNYKGYKIVSNNNNIQIGDWGMIRNVPQDLQLSEIEELIEKFIAWYETQKFREFRYIEYESLLKL